MLPKKRKAQLEVDVEVVVVAALVGVALLPKRRSLRQHLSFIPKLLDCVPLLRPSAPLLLASAKVPWLLLLMPGKHLTTVSSPLSFMDLA